jgi:hypothetical protein
MSPESLRLVKVEEGSPVRTRRRRATHYALAAVLYLALAALFIHDWDGFVFENSVRDFWNGKTPYSVAEDRPFYTFLNVDDTHPQWYAYPPLPLLAMSLTYAPEILWNVPSPVERVLLKLPMIIGTLALAWVAEAWARHLNKPPETVRRLRLLMLFNPFLIIIGPVWGMTDPALMALFLSGALAFEKNRPVAAGVLLGLSALVKPFAVLLAVPLAAYFVYERGWKTVFRTVGVAAATSIAFCLPFLLTTPKGFIQQIALFHLSRPVQGWSIWRLVPSSAMDASAIGLLSLCLVGASLVLLAFLAPRVRTPSAPILLTLAASVQMLFWNRIVNDQYLVMIVAPLALLHGLRELTGVAERASRWIPGVFSVATALVGFHFLTFIPPDIALPAFGRPVDVVAYEVRRSLSPLPAMHWPVGYGGQIFAALVAANVFASYRFARRWIPSLHLHRDGRRREFQSRVYSGSASMFILLVALLPTGAPGAFVPAMEHDQTDRPLVGAFYYLWWHNPAHDPDIRYGNWMKVSQTPEMGYYTNTRGVARDHAHMMRQNGIDVAIVSYHTGEYERMKVFMEEAAGQGLLVAPLIELNQIYDVLQYHPVDEQGKAAPYAAFRMDPATQAAITRFVLELRELMGPTAPLYRVEGKPVIFFYDSYVSAVSYDEPSKRLLSQQLLQDYSVPQLRHVFQDPDLEGTIDSVMRHYPQPPKDLSANDTPAKAFYEGARTPLDDKPNGLYINQSAYWRNAHLELHRQFWSGIRAALQADLGPLFLVSGEAFNERAGFEAGIVKALVGYGAFDGSFIYSPSFVWGNQPRTANGSLAPDYQEIFRAWEDRNIWLTSTARGRDAYSAYGVAPAYDDTVNRPLRGFKIPAYPGGESTYDRMWRSALRYTPNLVVVATFNEFFEGSSIEPSAQYQDSFLNETSVFHQRLRDRPAPGVDVVVVFNERMSRTHPSYSESDQPHEWGLRTLAAAARSFPGSNLVALDAMFDAPAHQAPPALLILEGGRDGYGLDSMTPTMRALLGGWINASVPTLVLGREVSLPVRNLLPSSCRENPTLSLGHSIFPAGQPDLDGEMNAKDVLLPDPTRSGVMVLQRAGSQYVAGLRCVDHPSIGFINTKPWSPFVGHTVSHPSDADCLRGVAAQLTGASIAMPPPPSVPCVGITDQHGPATNYNHVGHPIQ